MRRHHGQPDGTPTPTASERPFINMMPMMSAHMALLNEGYSQQEASLQVVRMRDMLEALDDGDWWAYSFHPAPILLGDSIVEQLLLMRAE